MALQTPQKQLFDILVTKNFDPDMLDVTGKPATNPAEADIFSFDYIADSGQDYGTVVIMFSDENDVQIYFGDNLGKGMEQEDKTSWFNFLHQIKNFATKNLMTFSTKDLNRLKYSMQGQAAIKEGLFESWTGTRTTSWNGRPTEARLMIKHKRPLGETDARFRYVESLFIETAEGERYKLPFTKLSGGRAMVEHMRQGGKVWDARGQHITEMVNELSVLSRFRRASHGKIFEGDTKDLVEQTNAYYESAQKTLKGMSHDRGYTAYFESWKPLEITEEEIMIEGLKHLFVTQSLDSRIEDALPLLARIQQQGNAMKEANIFEAWVDNLAEGTWATPDSKEKQAKLVELMSKELVVGPDATNATEQLYDLIGDDELFDQLEALAETDPDADCRQVVFDRMQMLSHDPDVQSVINAIQTSAEATMNPTAQVNPTELDEGSMKQWLWNEAERMDKDAFVANADEYGMTAEEAAEWWHSINGDDDYAEEETTLESILKNAGLTQEADVPTISGSLGGMGGMTTDKPDVAAPAMPNINDIVKSKLDMPASSAPVATPTSAPATPAVSPGQAELDKQLTAVDKAQGGDSKRIDLTPAKPNETPQQALDRQLGDVNRAYKASPAGQADISANPPGAKPAVAPAATSTAPAVTTTTPASTPAPTTAPKANVSAAELDNFRKEVGNQNATLGQYLNAKQGLTAIKGGANDPDVIQARLGAGGQAYRPGGAAPATGTAGSPQAGPVATTAPTAPAKPAEPGGMTTDKPATTAKPASGFQSFDTAKKAPQEPASEPAAGRAGQAKPADAPWISSMDRAKKNIAQQKTGEQPTAEPAKPTAFDPLAQLNQRKKGNMTKAEVDKIADKANFESYDRSLASILKHAGIKK